MMWKVSYDRINLNGDRLIPSKTNIILGEEFAEPYGGIEADSQIEAKEKVIEYITELMESNCLLVKLGNDELIVCDSTDNQEIEKYCNFICEEI